MDIKFEGISINPEAIARHESVEAWIAADGHQFFAGQEAQEAKMKAIYEECCKAVGKTTEKPKTTARNKRQPETSAEETAPVNPETEEGGE